MIRWSNFGFAAVGLLLAVSSIWVTVKNYQLREELAAANVAINALSAGAFREGSTSPVLRQPLVLIPLDAGLGKPIPTGKQDGSALNNAQCKRCTPDSTRKEEPILAPVVPTLSLLELKRHYLPNDLDSDFTLFVFFSPTDCPACLREAEVWQTLFRERETLHLSVVGVVGHCSQQEAEAAARQLGITFPVLFDVNSVLASAFGFEKTPEKILVNRQAKVILTSPGYQREEMQRSFEHEVRQKVRVRIDAS